jgi:hypothetical protein
MTRDISRNEQVSVARPGGLPHARVDASGLAALGHIMAALTGLAGMETGKESTKIVTAPEGPDDGATGFYTPSTPFGVEVRGGLISRRLNPTAIHGLALRARGIT